MVRTAVATAALLCIFCAAAFAQDESSQVRLLGVNSLHGSIELQGLYQSEDDLSKSPRSDTLSLEKSVTEILTLSMNGFIYHSRFLTFNGSIGLNLQQGNEEVETPVQNQTGSLNEIAPEYSLSGLLLGQHLVSLGYSVSKTTSTALVPFQPLTTTSQENQQLALYLKNAMVPTTLSFAHDDSAQKEFGFGENRNEDITTAGLQSNNRTEHSSTTFNYQYLQDYATVEEVSTVSTKVDTERYVQDGALNNILRFGQNDWAMLTSRASYRDETGSFPSSVFDWNESLLLRHTSDLSTQYGVDYSRTTVGGEENDLTSAQASLTHQLYQSLSSNVRVYGTYENLEGATEDTYGFGVNEDYRKKIPGGILTVNAGGGYQITDDRTQAQVVSVLKESQTLSNTATSFLNNPNVVPGSVVVMNSAGILVYLQNVDYELIPHATLTEIRRIPTGAIANGAAVLVSYQYQTGLPITYSTRDLHGRIQLDLFDHLQLYAFGLALPETFISGANAGQLQSLYETLLGGSFRWAPATLTAEHEIYNTSLAPYYSDRVSLDVAWPINEVHRIGGDVTYRYVAFQELGQGSETLRSVGLTYQATPRKWPSVNASVGYEWDSSLGLPSEYIFGRVRFDYRIRNTILALDLELNQLNDTQERQLTQYVFFSIRREIF